MIELFKFKACKRPLLVSIPHAGITLPSGVKNDLSAEAKSLPDTDWFVDRLYEWAPELGAGLIVANFSRYLIDLNRSSDNAPLYDSNTPGLVPSRTFSGSLISDRNPPDETEVKLRVSKYWRPYHDAIRKELDRLLEEFGYAVLFDAHSIRSRVPELFDGQLPDLNLGTNDAQSASSDLVKTVEKVFQGQDRYSHVVDGRFKGGFITRRYGRPGQRIHALQLEMSQSVYMNEVRQEFDKESADQAMDFLKTLLSQIVQWCPDRV